MAGFNHVVSQKRFVGYFLAAPDLCGVTVFEAIANDETLVVLPRRLDIDIKAADRAELDAGEGGRAPRSTLCRDSAAFRASRHT